MLDFDYGSDDDDDNTAPSPQPSQITTGLERFQIILYFINHFFIQYYKYNIIIFCYSILSNPEVIRQLQTLQQQMSQQKQDIEEKMRKLQEMKQQEEEFDKHLAQTVPVLNSFFLFIFH